jgi:YVTN family beta-propeller protein
MRLRQSFPLRTSLVKALRVIASTVLLSTLTAGSVHAQFRAYVTDFQTLWVIDTGTNAVSDIEIRNVYLPIDVAVSADGAFVYIVDSYNFEVVVVDTALRRVIAHIPIARDPLRIALSPDGSQAYVLSAAGTGYGLNALSVIDLERNTVTVRMPLPFSPNDLAISPV